MNSQQTATTCSGARTSSVRYRHPVGVFANNLPSGHFFLTELLVPALTAGARTSPDGHARVVTTSSSAAYFASGLQWETFKEHPNRHKMGTQLLYCQSKLVRATGPRVDDSDGC